MAGFCQRLILELGEGARNAVIPKKAVGQEEHLEDKLANTTILII